MSRVVKTSDHYVDVRNDEQIEQQLGRVKVLDMTTAKPEGVVVA